ncbi:MAG: MYG1 family protein [Candidatus Paceibacterota bacterium]
MKKVIATHNGPFHSDDIFAVATISLYLGKDAEIEVIRTRDEDRLKEADILVDIGGEYDPKNQIFDHHQEGGAGERLNGVPYASFGLVWDHYGKSLCQDAEVARFLDERLVQPIDAEDNGIKITREVIEGVSPYTIQDLFFAFSPSWKEEADQDVVFQDCVAIAKSVLDREIKKTKDELEAQRIVRDLYERSSDKRLLVFDNYYPWKRIVTSYPEPLIVVYPGMQGDTWHAQVVPERPESFDARISFPEKWAGKRNGDLAEVSGVADAVFCHNKAFLAVAVSKEGAIKMASKALEDN